MQSTQLQRHKMKRNSTLDILDDTNPQAARALRGFLSILISKGRKAGFNFVFASTRAVGLKKQLSQVSTIAFRLKDTDEERYAFGQSGFGAERLSENYFLSKIGPEVRMTGSFNPSDRELGEFLLRHTTKALDKPTWVEGVFKPVEQEPQPRIMHIDEARRLTEIDDNAPIIVPAADVVDEDVSRILELDKAGKSESVIIRELWGVTGGGSYYKRQAQVRAALGQKVTSSSTSTPVFSPEIGLQAA